MLSGIVYRKRPILEAEESQDWYKPRLKPQNNSEQKTRQSKPL
jgi:hypothetical protein